MMKNSMIKRLKELLRQINEVDSKAYWLSLKARKINSK